ncbi:MAG TPA: hypothetical protein RMH99_25670 [Sandaracinaceae bacterium LLY-WYZ-13_1]|nr:hypothetical protein [Sandaracinaceae bacterium LLY-WYZ-13_1]
MEGFREALLPRAAPHEWLAGRLESLASGVRVVEPGWAPEEPPYHTFVAQDGLDEHAWELLVEYAADNSGAEDVRALIVPWRSCTSPAAPEDPRHRLRLIAERLLGPRRVRSVCLSTSKTAEETLRAVVDAETPSDLPKVLHLDPRDEEDATAPILANHMQAVLEGVRRVDGSLLKVRPERARMLAEALYENGLALDADVPPRTVLESLEPGGELHDWLFRRLVPVPLS